MAVATEELFRAQRSRTVMRAWQHDVAESTGDEVGARKMNAR